MASLGEECVYTDNRAVWIGSVCLCVCAGSSEVVRCGQYFPETWARLCVSYLFYGGDSDNKEEGQAAGDWAGGGVDDKLQERQRGREEQQEEDVEYGGGWRGERMPSTLSLEVQQREKASENEESNTSLAHILHYFWDM